MGDPRDFTNFVSAVIDQKAFDKIKALHRRGEGVGRRRGDRRRRVRRLRGVVHPAHDHRGEEARLRDDVRGGLRAGHVRLRLRRRDWSETLELVDSTSPYALTGAVFARDRRAIREAMDRARARRGQLLRQRQAHGRRRGPAAVRGRPRLGHERQGGLDAQPAPLGERPLDQGELRAADDYRYPFMEEA
jgi:1-pyrroline-5-carboxylate dehydrogenase